ncbi:MAG: hypothetical protein SGJ24_08010 [Chloroflexota bacterium]|nr:hypothetical protein [Chloroflexota bacterium]
MRRIVSFGSYTFPDTVPERGEILRANFGDGVRHVARLPGLDGGVDLHGADPFPGEIGTVRCRFVLVAESASAMQTARDAVMAMARYGRAALTMQTGTNTSRWTWAKVASIALPSAHDSISERLCEVAVEWQVAYPRWFATAAASPVVAACSGTMTDFTITTGGNAIAAPVITIDPGTVIGSAGVTVRRMVASAAADEIVYGASLLASDALTIDCRALAVRKNGANAYANAFAAAHPAWLRLQPGANTIRVILGAGETASVSVAWDETWY